jgi:hypothetical protein
MAETTLLKTSAIVRTATFAPPQHGPIKTGELPLVQVRMAPGGPQVQNGQQKEVEILPPRDAKSALAIGGLPLIQVKMTQNGPQADDGRDQTVVIKDPRRAGVATGGLPMLQVKMTQAGPQIQTLSTVQGGPPQIPAAAPALSAQRQTVPRQAALPVVPELPMDQLMLCRHLVEKYLVEQRDTSTAAVNVTTESDADADADADDADADADADADDAEAPVSAANVKLAELTILMLDEVLVATAVRIEALNTHAPEIDVTAVVTVMPTLACAAATSIAPAPTASYVAGRVGTRPLAFAGARAQRNSSLAPRRVARADSPLPPVIVKMDGGRAVVQNKAEIDQVRESVLNPAPSFEALDGSPESVA